MVEGTCKPHAKESLHHDDGCIDAGEHGSCGGKQGRQTVQARALHSARHRPGRSPIIFERWSIQERQYAPLRVPARPRMDGAHWLRQPILRGHRRGIQLTIGPVPENGRRIAAVTCHCGRGVAEDFRRKEASSCYRPDSEEVRVGKTTAFLGQFHYPNYSKTTKVKVSVKYTIS